MARAGSPIVALLAGAALAAPATASADVYCVDTGPYGCDHTGLSGAAGFQSALDSAGNSAQDDTIRLGPASRI